MIPLICLYAGDIVFKEFKFEKSLIRLQSGKVLPLPTMQFNKTFIGADCLHCVVLVILISLHGLGYSELHNKKSRVSYRHSA